MRGALLLMLALALAGCGGKGESPAANNSAGAVVAPIVDGSETQNEMAKGKGLENPVPTVPAVPRETPPVPVLETKAPERAEYRAIGTEPFWAVTVRGSVATLQRPDKVPIRFAVEREDDRRTLRYLGESFTMTVSQGPCSDGMSDAIWSDRVQIAFGEGTLKGCGGERDDDPEAEGL